MSDENSIAAKLDPKFIELMIRELEGQSRVVLAADSPASEEGGQGSGLESQDLSFEAVATGEPQDRADDATPLDPLPALVEQDDVDVSPPSPKRRPVKGSARSKVMLEIREPNLRERVFALHRKPVVIGRGRDADITVRDSKISRQHVRIESVEGRIIVTDLNSQNGTRVNDRPIREQEVISGDVIKIGQTTIRVRRAEE